MAKTKEEPSKFDVLRDLIADYVDKAVADPWKGGGDPADVRVLELERQLAYHRLNAQLEKIERETPQPIIGVGRMASIGSELRHRCRTLHRSATCARRG